MKLFLSFVFLLLPLFSFTQVHGFQESSQSALLLHEHFSPGGMGGGVAFFDYNNDYYEDIYLIGGKLSDQLFKNNGDGTFENVTVEAGINHPYYIFTNGVVTGDLDNDGFRDIIITVTKYNDPIDQHPILYRNNGDGTFANLTWGNQAFSIPVEDKYNFSATLGDVNLDGFLDLYICNWIEEQGLILDSVTNELVELIAKGGPNRLYINNGDLTFSEAAIQYGVEENGCSLAAVFSDYDKDRDLDLLITNDFGMWDRPDALYQNDYPNVLFKDESAPSGFNSELYGMGIGVGDYDRDGDLDYYKTSIGTAVLMQNQNDGTFFEVAEIAGVEDTYVNGKPPHLSIHWGAGFMDIDNDALLDLAVARGRVGADFLWPSLDSMPDKLWRNLGDGTFADVSDWFDIPNYQQAHGLAYADYDNDGDMDLVFANSTVNPENKVNSTPALYQNMLSGGGNWLKVKTVGTINNRDGFGTHLTIHVNGVSWLHEISGGGQGHLSQHSSVAHFGLGPAEIIDSLVVSWPGNLSPVQVFYDLPANHYIEITEGVDTYEVIQGQTTDVRNPAKTAAPLRIFPNPTRQDRITIHLPNDFSGTGQLRLFTSTGQLVREMAVRDVMHQLEVSDLSPGIYLLEVRNEQGIWREQMVVQ